MIADEKSITFAEIFLKIFENFPSETQIKYY